MADEQEELRSFAAHSFGSRYSTNPFAQSSSRRMLSLKNVAVVAFTFATFVLSLVALIGHLGKDEKVSEDYLQSMILRLIPNKTYQNEEYGEIQGDLIAIRNDFLSSQERNDTKLDITDLYRALGMINVTIQNHSREQVKIENDVKELQRIISSTNFVPRNCDEFGTTNGTGYFIIDPLSKKDGSTKFKAWCDFEKGFTIIDHDRPDEIKIAPCNGAYCFKVDVTYNATMTNMKRLLKVSKDCYQKIDFKCFSAEFSNFASWTDSQGKHQAYFSKVDGNECQCHSTKTCFSPNHLKNVTCNCDFSTSSELLDEITINSKELLPLISFQYSHMRSLPHHYGSVKIGPLICKGLRKPKPKVMKTCNDHKANGDPSGYYWIELGKRFTFAFCNTSIENGTKYLTKDFFHFITYPDVCHDMNYHVLDDPSQHIENGTAENGHCKHKNDTSFGSTEGWKGEGWYRIMKKAGTKLYEKKGRSATIFNKCSSKYAGWLNTPHPQVIGTTINGTICIDSQTEHCRYSPDFKIQIKNCGSYFLYYLMPLYYSKESDLHCLMKYCTV